VACHNYIQTAINRNLIEAAVWGPIKCRNRVKAMSY